MYIYRRESAKYFSDSLLYILVITTLSKKINEITNVGKDYLSEKSGLFNTSEHLKRDLSKHKIC